MRKKYIKPVSRVISDEPLYLCQNSWKQTTDNIGDESESGDTGSDVNTEDPGMVKGNNGWWDDSWGF